MVRRSMGGKKVRRVRLQARRSAGVAADRKYSLIKDKDALDKLIRDLWQAESVGLAFSNSSPPGAGQQQSTRGDHGATGIAFSQSPGKSAFVDLDNFAEGKESAVAALRELFANALLEKSLHDLKRATAL